MATKAAQQADLKPEIERGPDADMRRGFVYSQSIREGTRAHDGDTITLAVSTGSP